eukprot:12455053-Alexandrium_andersonii.AAC.1
MLPSAVAGGAPLPAPRVVAPSPSSAERSTLPPRVGDGPSCPRQLRVAPGASRRVGAAALGRQSPSGAARRCV